jgi:hypothetical protein
MSRIVGCLLRRPDPEHGSRLLDQQLLRKPIPNGTALILVAVTSLRSITLDEAREKTLKVTKASVSSGCKQTNVTEAA